jgi:hypothetical protein
MMRLCDAGLRLCDGLSRREFLRVGGLAVGGLTLPGLLRGRAAAASPAPRARACIQLFMWGGPSQLETFDLKPHAPDGVRGEFRPADTNVPGIRICEHLPLLARTADRYAILRSVTHTGVNHGTSAYHMLTGRIHPTPGTLRHPAPDDHPHVGCAVARFGRAPRGEAARLPRYVTLPSVLHDGDGGEVPGQGPGILGRRYAPFQVAGDPSRPDFRLDTLKLSGDVDGRRLRDRLGLRAELDRELGRAAGRPAADALDGYYERAWGLLQSAAARRAFDLADEPDRARDHYGRNHFGQSCLLARRLVEAGVPLVTVYWNTPSLTTSDSWDTHADGFTRLKDHLLPPFDRAMTALLGDLHARGLLDETLVVWLGEFGRTPKINKNAGRDHWGFCQSVLMAGAGVRGGRVYGSSDGSAAYAAESPVSPDDLAATVFHALGVNPSEELHDTQGRPQPLCTGKTVLGLF